MEITIRTAGTADAAIIADLSRKTFYETFAADNSPENMDKFMNETFTREKLMEEVGAAGNYFILALEGDKPLGYVRMRDGKQLPELEGKKAIEIARIYADKAAIGKGIGSALMKKSLELAAGLDREIVWLGVWEHNHRAIGFYKKWGFERFATHVFNLGNDSQTDWLMMRTVNSAG